MASSLRKQSFPQFGPPTFIPNIFYARLTSLAACQNDWLLWNAAPWLGPFLTVDYQLIIWDRLAREKNLQIEPKDLEATAILHLGTTQSGRQNIFVMFPNIDKNDIMNAALRRAFPDNMRDPRFGTGSFKMIKINSQVLRVEAMKVDYDTPIVEPLNGRFLPQLWEAVQEIVNAETHLSKFKDMVLFAFSALEFPCCEASIDGGWLGISYPMPVGSAKEVLEDELNTYDEFMDIDYVEKETLHIRGEFRFHAKEQEEKGEAGNQ